MSGVEGTSRSQCREDFESNSIKISELERDSKENEGLRQITLRFNPETVAIMQEEADVMGVSLAKAWRLFMRAAIEDLERPGPILHELLDDIYSPAEEVDRKETGQSHQAYFVNSKEGENLK